MTTASAWAARVQGAGRDELRFQARWRRGDGRRRRCSATLQRRPLVRAGGKIEGDVGLEGTEQAPVVDDELAVDEDTIAAAFAGTLKRDDVAAGGGSGVEAGEAVRDFDGRERKKAWPWRCRGRR